MLQPKFQVNEQVYLTLSLCDTLQQARDGYNILCMRYKHENNKDLLLRSRKFKRKLNKWLKNTDNALCDVIVDIQVTDRVIYTLKSGLKVAEKYLETPQQREQYIKNTYHTEIGKNLNNCFTDFEERSERDVFKKTYHKLVLKGVKRMYFDYFIFDAEIEYNSRFKGISRKPSLCYVTSAFDKNKLASI